MKRKVKLRVKIFCALGAVYFLFVLCMTVYAQTTHINALPTVTLMRVEDGVVPREAVYGNRQRGYRVYTVKQEDGAFGKAYFLHVVESERSFRPSRKAKCSSVHCAEKRTPWRLRYIYLKMKCRMRAWR